jgi:hypothetical protein
MCFHVTLLAPRILRWFPDKWETCAPLFCMYTGGHRHDRNKLHVIVFLVCVCPCILISKWCQNLNTGLRGCYWVNSSVMLWSYLTASIVTWYNKTYRLSYLNLSVSRDSGITQHVTFLSISYIFRHCYTNDMKKNSPLLEHVWLLNICTQFM